MSNQRGKSLVHLQQVIGYEFTQQALLKRALTHCSALQSSLFGHLERLEFLGDAVLGLVIAEHLHHRFTDQAEGQLSRMRASLVCRDSLLLVADSWSLSTVLVVGEGERGRAGEGDIKSPSIAANAVEAVIGAIFEDSGWDQARRVVLAAWQPMLVEIGSQDTRDAKSRLQELTQGKGWGLPEYSLEDRGAGSKPRFKATCRVQNNVVGHGQGDRKKLAELASAEQAWSKLKDE
ncbi:MAG: ribonuclease III [Mariprofundus sp.]